MNRNYVTNITIIIGSALIIFFVLIKLNFINTDESIDNEENYVSITSNTETCLNCHLNTKGYSNYHNPELIGCTSCHLGNGTEKDKIKSHEGMILIPGNLSDAEETCGKCHPNELNKIQNSLMTTNSGLVAVDKYIFGEA